MLNPARVEEQGGDWVLVADVGLGSGFSGIHYGSRDDLTRVADYLFGMGIADSIVVVPRVDLDQVREGV